MTTLFIISGWAHPSCTLQPLVSLLTRRYPARIFSPHELDAGPDHCGYARALIRELEGEQGPCFLAGWSLGGMIALEVASALADRVGALILVSSAPRLAAAPDFPQGVPPPVLKAMRRTFRRTPERTLSEFFANAAFPRRLPASALAEKVAAAAALDPEELEEQLRYLAETDLREAARRLSMPALVLHGRRDRIIPLGAASWLGQKLPRASMIVREDGGHALPLDEPDWVADRIESFLKAPA